MHFCLCVECFFLWRADYGILEEETAGINSDRVWTVASQQHNADNRPLDFRNTQNYSFSHAAMLPFRENPCSHYQAVEASRIIIGNDHVQSN